MRLISRMMILMFVFLMIEAPIASSQTQQGRDLLSLEGFRTSRASCCVTCLMRVTG